MSFFDQLREDINAERAEAAARGLGGDQIGDVPVDQEPTEDPFVQKWEPPGPVADRFYWSDDKVCMLRGPVGSGKTTANLRKPMRRALGIPISTIDGFRRYKVVIARHTFRQLWNTTIPSWIENVPRSIGQWAGGRGDPVTQTIQFQDDHGPVEFIAEFQAFGESEAEIVANVRGVQTTDFLFEEADTIHQVMFMAALGRINRYPRKSHYMGGAFHPHPYPEDQREYGQINMTYNAPDEENWVVRLEELDEDDTPEGEALRSEMQKIGAKVSFFRQPGGTDPDAENLQNLGKGYYDTQRVIMRSQGRGDMVTRLIDNQIGYIKAGELVFEKHYSPQLHIAREPLEPHAHYGLRIGLDQGFYGAAVIGQLIPPFQWRILAELWFRQRVFAQDFGVALRDLLDERFPEMRIEGVWSDMAGEQGSAIAEDQETWNQQVALAANLEIEAQYIGHNRIAPRLGIIRAGLDHIYQGNPGLLIDPSCKLLRKGFEATYVYEKDPDKASNKGDKPKKRGNRSADAMDALSYMMLSEADDEGLPPIAGLVPVPGRPDGRAQINPLIGHNRRPFMQDTPPPRATATEWDMDAYYKGSA